MLRPCQWLEGTDVIEAAAPHCRERRGNCGLPLALMVQLCSFFPKENRGVNFFLPNSSVRLWISGCCQSGKKPLVWRVSSQIRFKEQDPLGSLYGNTVTTPAASGACSIALSVCSLSLRGRRWEEWATTQPGQWGFLLLLFVSLFYLGRVNKENNSNYFHWHSLFAWTGIDWLAIGGVHLKILECVFQVST